MLGGGGGIQRFSFRLKSFHEMHEWMSGRAHSSSVSTNSSINVIRENQRLVLLDQKPFTTAQNILVARFCLKFYAGNLKPIKSVFAPGSNFFPQTSLFLVRVNLEPQVFMKVLIHNWLLQDFNSQTHLNEELWMTPVLWAFQEDDLLERVRDAEEGEGQEGRGARTEGWRTEKATRGTGLSGFTCLHPLAFKASPYA